MTSLISDLVLGIVDFVVALVIQVGKAVGWDPAGLDGEGRELRVGWFHVFFALTILVALLLVVLFALGLAREQGWWS